VPVDIQNAEASSSLVAGLGIKGGLRLKLDETIVGVEVIGDLTKGSPYASVKKIGGVRAQAAVALEISAISIEPGPGGILVIDQISVDNIQGADANFEIRVLTAAQIASITTVNSSLAFDFNSPFIAGAIARDGALLRSLSDAVAIGPVVLQMNVLTGERGVYDLPGGYALYGDDPIGPVALTVWNSAINLAAQASFIGRVYLNKG